MSVGQKALPDWTGTMAAICFPDLLDFVSLWDNGTVKYLQRLLHWLHSQTRHHTATFWCLVVATHTGITETGCGHRTVNPEPSSPNFNPTLP